MRRVAYQTVLRACGFGTLTIFCVMVGMSFMPRLAYFGQERAWAAALEEAER